MKGIRNNTIVGAPANHSKSTTRKYQQARPISRNESDSEECDDKPLPSRNKKQPPSTTKKAANNNKASAASKLDGNLTTRYRYDSSDTDGSNPNIGYNINNATKFGVSSRKSANVAKPVPQRNVNQLSKKKKEKKFNDATTSSSSSSSVDSDDNQAGVDYDDDDDDDDEEVFGGGTKTIVAG